MILERRPHTGTTPADRSVTEAIRAEARRLGLGGTRPLGRLKRARTTTAPIDPTVVEHRDEDRRAAETLNWGAR